MQFIFWIAAVLMFSCQGNPPQENPAPSDTVQNTAAEKQELKTYSNARFQGVKVLKADSNTYTISGKGQIFEANFGWVVEDGHNELQAGHQMTDAGAPEWGNFEFRLKVKKERPNSTLTLILFETSAMDGSRQHLLPITLP